VGKSQEILSQILVPVVKPICLRNLMVVCLGLKVIAVTPKGSFPSGAIALLFTTLMIFGYVEVCYK
jgi:hypothetical protein